jgi:hypothetical protein
VGLSFIGTAYSEPTLIKYAYAYEQATKLRRPPTYIPTLPFPNGQSDYNPTKALPERLEFLMERLKINQNFRTLLRNL